MGNGARWVSLLGGHATPRNISRLYGAGAISLSPFLRQLLLPLLSVCLPGCRIGPPMSLHFVGATRDGECGSLLGFDQGVGLSFVKEDFCWD